MAKKIPGQGMSKSTPPEDSTNWVGDTFSGSAGGQTGNLEIRWHRSDSILLIDVLRYMITGNGTRNSANINIVVQADGSRNWKLGSNDRKQDGIWHTWSVRGQLAIGNATLITVKVEIVFDKPGIDDRTIITRKYGV